MVSLQFCLGSLQYVKRSCMCPEQLDAKGKLLLLHDNDGLETTLLRLHQELQRLICHAVQTAHDRKLPQHTIHVSGPAIVDSDTWLFSYVGFEYPGLEGASLRCLRKWYYQHFWNGHCLRISMNNARTDIMFPRVRICKTLAESLLQLRS